MIQQTGIPTADSVREVFRGVLGGPEFHYAGRSPLVSALIAVLEWLQDVISRWFPDLGDSEARVASWIVLGVGALLVVTLVVRRFRNREPRRKGVDPVPEQAPRLRSAAEWMAWARSSAESGHLRDAATGVYQATILDLDARGALRYREWKTPGDYALEISTPEVRAPFMDFLGRFLELAFGAPEPTVEAFAALTDGAARLGETA